MSLSFNQVIIYKNTEHTDDTEFHGFMLVFRIVLNNEYTKHRKFSYKT
jgi:hypothetical protein